jgi:HSP20 family molecular chaperone IbpA
MPTILNTTSHTDSRKGPARPAPAAAFLKPNYDCRDQADGVELVVYVPGVDASGVEIEARGSDLIVTARKTRFVRVNWTSLRLEGAQRDYLLRLRLGTRFDFGAMQAEIRDGVLTVTVPKRQAALAGAAVSWRRVA